jgi:hypothetical protein
VLYNASDPSFPTRRSSDLQASTRLDDGYIVSLGGRSGADLDRMTRYAKKELAAVLAEQALYAGGIEFTQVGGELRAVMRTITGREGEEL